MGTLCSEEEEQGRTEDICSCRPVVWKPLKVERKMEEGELVKHEGGASPPHL